MDLTALERTASGLESSLDRWEFWLAVATSLVVIGLILEYWHEVRDLIRDRPIKWKSVQKLAGAILVTAGVGAELGVQFKASTVETDLRGVNHRIEALLNSEAETARLKAADAEGTAKGFGAKIAESQRDTAEAKRDAESAKAQAAASDLARVKIEAKVAWRHLTESQQREIGSSLGRKFSNQGVSVWFSSGDTEGSSFAGDIAGALRATRTLRAYAPASIVRLMESGRLGDPIPSALTGVGLQSTKDEASRQLAEAIVTELTSRGFDATRETDPPFDPNPIPQVWVNVWTKPDSPQGEFKLADRKASANK